MTKILLTGAAAFTRRPILVFLVGALRLMDVPADLVYRLLADDLGPFGSFGLLAAPVFNLATGVYLALVGARALRQAPSCPSAGAVAA